MISALDPAIAFYLDSEIIKDQIGFTFTDVMTFDDEKLEECHGYVQWLFPVREPSAYIKNAPLVTERTMVDFVEFQSVVTARMKWAFLRMLQFYFHGQGLDKWVTPRNHNFLRITRILKSLRLFGLEEEEKHLYNDYLLSLLRDNEEARNIIGPVTVQFWQDAHEEEIE